jgi:queuine tRNA-ribosyltransferase
MNDKMLMGTDKISIENAAVTRRVGKLHTRKGDVQTPFFMPDATRASVRGLTRGQLLDHGIFPMVVNTYHLMLQPTAAYLDFCGGVHKFMNWDGPLLSDSGGYQVYSLIHKNASLGKITEDGAHFKSVLDGSLHTLTPARAIELQFQIGTDMMVVLDDPRPPHVSRSEHEDAVERTIRWAKECKDVFDEHCRLRGFDEGSRPLLFSVVQGGPYVDLREKCARALSDIQFDGYGFGGRHIDDGGRFMTEIVAATANALPANAPRFALGIGTPHDIVRCHDLGWDFFDCVIPTREGRHGRIFTMRHNVSQSDSIYERGADFYEVLNIENALFTDDFTPLEEGCDCYACKNYSRAYLHHLFRVKEPLGPQMAALHNLRFYMRLMEVLRGNL